jgi:hypothetical protein
VQMRDDIERSAFDVPMVARRAGVSESFIWGEIRNGELESFRAGDRRLITPEQEARWIARKIEREAIAMAEREAALARERPDDGPPPQPSRRRRRSFRKKVPHQR